MRRRGLPRGELSPFQRWFRHWFSRTVSAADEDALPVKVVGRERLPAEPALYCFNHLSWMDPLAPAGDVPEPAAPALLRPEAGRPADRACATGSCGGRRSRPVQPAQGRPADVGPVGPGGVRLRRRRSRSPPRARSTSTKATSCRSRRAPRTWRCAAASRSCRSRSRGRRGRASAAASWSASASRSRRGSARRARPSPTTRR